MKLVGVGAAIAKLRTGSFFAPAQTNIGEIINNFIRGLFINDNFFHKNTLFNINAMPHDIRE